MSDGNLTRRAFFILLCKTILTTVLGFNLYRLQILSGDKYKLLSDKNRIRINILQPPRGIITDRRGVVLASNQFTYSASIEDVKNLDLVLGEISGICDPEQVIKSNDQIVLSKKLSWDDISKIESNVKINHLVKISQSYRRTYPYGPLTGYITGYTGIISKTDLDKKSPKKNTIVGKNGLEMFCEDLIKGQHGVQRVEVNAFGKTVREISMEPPIKGEQLKTSIDINLQAKIAELTYEKPGIHIAVDVNNGEILAMYSSPGYDPNLFIDGINKDDWQKIMSDPNKPMINRAISSLYPPGSTFKMITLLAILKAGVSPRETVFCSGKHNFGSRTLHCWQKYGHGNINAYNALENSCNIYFGVQGIKAGIDLIGPIAKSLGLGEQTGVELPFESKGLIPNKDWKFAKYKRVWTFGDTINASIGQGYILTTPIQLAVMTARIASGKLVQPTLLTEKKKFSNINIPKEYLDIVRQGMYNVMKNHHWEGLNIAGKTGTAQVISKRDAAGKFKDHSLFVGFAPYQNPKYAVVSIVENAGWGSENALPITKQIFRSIFEAVE